MKTKQAGKKTKRKRTDDIRWIRMNKNGILGIVAHKTLPRYSCLTAGESFIKVKLVEVTL